MTSKFELNEKERISYLFQLEILRKLDPQNDVYKNLQKILENGYSLHYKDVRDVFIMSSEISEADCLLVLDILDMYDVLIQSAKCFGINLEQVRFRGFDCNNSHEAKLCSYAKFFMEDYERYDDIQELSKGVYNSHMEMLPKYRRMLALWGKKERLTKEEFDQILTAESK